MCDLNMISPVNCNDKQYLLSLWTCQNRLKLLQKYYDIDASVDSINHQTFVMLLKCLLADLFRRAGIQINQRKYTAECKPDEHPCQFYRSTNGHGCSSGFALNCTPYLGGRVPCSLLFQQKYEWCPHRSALLQTSLVLLHHSPPKFPWQLWHLSPCIWSWFPPDPQHGKQCPWHHLRDPQDVYPSWYTLKIQVRKLTWTQRWCPFAWWHEQQFS